MIKLDKRVGVCAPSGTVRVMQRGHLIGIAVDDKIITLRTPEAVPLGLNMVKQSADCLPTEFVVMTINGVDVEMLPAQAKQIGGALLRKSDFADDFQISQHKRITNDW